MDMYSMPSGPINAIVDFQGGGVLELKPGGADITVTEENVIEYIYRYVDMRMLSANLKCLEVSQIVSHPLQRRSIE
jgi:hypothetical protein